MRVSIEMDGMTSTMHLCPVTILCFLFCVSCTMMQRIQESEIRRQGYWVAPFSQDTLLRVVNFSSVGWMQPGHVPTPGPGTRWIHPNPIEGKTYPKMPLKPRECITKQTSGNFTRICYRNLAESFFIGEAIPISKQFKCSAGTCNIRLQSLVTVREKISFPVAASSQEWFNLVYPRTPTKMYLPQEAHEKISFNMTIVSPSTGYFWYKPLYWALSGLAFHSVFYPHSSKVVSSTVNSIYPIIRDGHIEGLVGFTPSIEPPPEMTSAHLLRWRVEFSL